jgi:hypothetical protein
LAHSATCGPRQLPGRGVGVCSGSIRVEEDCWVQSECVARFLDLRGWTAARCFFPPPEETDPDGHLPVPALCCNRVTTSPRTIGTTGSGSVAVWACGLWGLGNMPRRAAPRRDATPQQSSCCSPRSSSPCLNRCELSRCGTNESRGGAGRRAHHTMATRPSSLRPGPRVGRSAASSLSLRSLAPARF